ncbi:MAG: hypothetical protein V1712_01065 [Patescibacteria group bacterium]
MMVEHWPKSIIGHFILTLLIFFAIDLLSIVSYFNPLSQIIIFVLLMMAFIALAFMDFSWAIILFFIELIIGSQGYLFFLNINQTPISIRLAWFIIIISVFLIRVIKNHDWLKFKTYLFYAWLLVILAFFWGAVNGYLRNDFGNWFLDLNGYLYLAIFLPLFIASNSHSIWNKLKLVIYPALSYLAIKTLILVYLYTHFSVLSLSPIYSWIRNTGFGEITYAGGNFFRIFSQSHIFILAAAVAWLLFLIIKWQQMNFDFKKFVSHYNWLVLFGLLQLSVLFASLSRSFWLAGLVTLAIGFLAFTFINKLNLKKILFCATGLLVVIIASVGLLFAITKFPIPLPLKATAGDILLARVTSGAGEAAGASRLQLLRPLVQEVRKYWLLGSGFGSTITYQSLDPRLTSSTAGGTGWYTTYAYEWGYLDTWLKIGLMGLLIYLFFWWLLFKNAFYYIVRNNQTLVPWLVLGGALAVFLTNITTPYLNHPLGIGLLLILGFYLQFCLNEKSCE